MGILFYLKYSLQADESLTPVILGIAFLIAMLSLYPWRNWVANKLDSRRTLMLANALIQITGEVEARVDGQEIIK